MSMKYTPDEFDDHWAIVVAKYELETNNQVVEISCKHEMWAESYLSGYFFAGMKSTQRCEGMNAYLKDYLKV